MAGTGTATVDFGATPLAEASVSVTDAGVTSSAYVEAFVMIDSTGDNDTDAHKHAAASWKLACEPGDRWSAAEFCGQLDLPIFPQAARAPLTPHRAGVARY